MNTQTKATVYGGVGAGLGVTLVAATLAMLDKRVSADNAFIWSSVGAVLGGAAGGSLATRGVPSATVGTGSLPSRLAGGAINAQLMPR